MSGLVNARCLANLDLGMSERRIEYLEIVTPFIEPDPYGFGPPQVRRWDSRTYDPPVDRTKLTNRFAWAIPTEAVLGYIGLRGPIVEVGAGTGYWAMLLRERGVDVVAYDRSPPEKGAKANNWHVDTPVFTEVLVGGPESAAKHPDRTLFLCWPPYNEAMASETLRAYAGQCVCYIGEGHGGCTGDDAFHEALEAEWDEEAEGDLLQWYGLHDRLHIYRRKAK